MKGIEKEGAEGVKGARGFAPFKPPAKPNKKIQLLVNGLRRSPEGDRKAFWITIKSQQAPSEAFKRGEAPVR